MWEYSLTHRNQESPTAPEFSLWGISCSWLLQLKPDQSETVCKPRGDSPAPGTAKWTPPDTWYILQLPGPLPGTDTKAGCCLLPPNMGLLLKGDPSAFSSGFYCTKRAEQNSNSDCTLPSSSPTLLYALGAISAGKRQALDSKQFVVLKFGHFWPMFRKRGPQYRQDDGSSSSLLTHTHPALRHWSHSAH